MAAMVDHDSIVLVIAAVFLITNFSGAGFTLYRIYLRRKRLGAFSDIGHDVREHPPRLALNLLQIFTPYEYPEEVKDAFNKLYGQWAVPKLGSYARIWAWVQVVKAAVVLVAAAPRLLAQIGNNGVGLKPDHGHRMKAAEEYQRGYRDGLQDKWDPVYVGPSQSVRNAEMADRYREGFFVTVKLNARSKSPNRGLVSRALGGARRKLHLSIRRRAGDRNSGAAKARPLLAC
jgi:hypothetical protein